MRRGSAVRRSLSCAAACDRSFEHGGAVCANSAALSSDLVREACADSWLSNLHRIILSNRSPASNGSASRITEAFNFLFAAGVGLLAGSLAGEAALNDSGVSENPEFQKPESGSMHSDAKLDTEGVVQSIRRGVEERLKSLKEEGAQIPNLTIAANGQQVAIRFPFSAKCDISRVIIDVVGHLGERENDGGSSSGMVVRAWDSPVARHSIISPVESGSKLDGEQASGKDESKETLRHLCVLIFEPLVGDKPPEIEFLKTGYFSSKELDAVASLLNIAGKMDLGADKKPSLKGGREGQLDGLTEAPKEGYRDSIGDNNWPGDRWRYRGGGNIGEVPRDRFATVPKRPAGRGHSKALETLEGMGVKVYGLENIGASKSDKEHIHWDTIVGYHEQKREIEDTVLLALQRPDVYDSIARGTRRKFESNRPRAILFEGPPGTGKTSCARVIASQARVPLLYVPVEVLVSKYYGESERLLASIFTTGNELPDGAIVFLDEIDSLATARDSEMHEATRRMLSVLLRQMDGFEQDSRIVVIAATNRKQDLDPALLSRFDSSIAFNLPDISTRGEIASQYARHLSPAELAALAAASDGMSGRDLHDVCQQAERRWASKLIRGVAGNPPTHGLPPIDEYIACAEKRQQTIVRLARQDGGFYGGSPLTPGPPHDKSWSSPNVSSPASREGCVSVA